MNPPVKLKDLAKALGISQNAVRAAMADGRITAFEKKKGAYEFDLERAITEYQSNTNRKLSRNPRFDTDDIDDDLADRDKMSVLDIEPKYWNVNEALQAKTIYSALKTKHELEVQQGKFYEKGEADREFNRMATTFARGLRSMHVRLKQKIPELTSAHLKIIESLAAELIEECEKKL